MPGFGDPSMWLRDLFMNYLFTTGYQMVPYENLQPILNEFGLKLFQNPTGYDISIEQYIKN